RRLVARVLQRRGARDGEERDVVVPRLPDHPHAFVERPAVVPHVRHRVHHRSELQRPPRSFDRSGSRPAAAATVTTPRAASSYRVANTPSRMRAASATACAGGISPACTRTNWFATSVVSSGCPQNGYGYAALEYTTSGMAANIGVCRTAISHSGVW